jgi:hypothetical protein
MPNQPRPGKRALTVRIDQDLIKRFKKTVKDGSGRPLYLTLAGLAERALTAELDRVEGILDRAYRDPTCEEPPPVCGRITHRAINNR